MNFEELAKFLELLVALNHGLIKYACEVKVDVLELYSYADQLEDILVKHYDYFCKHPFLKQRVNFEIDQTRLIKKVSNYLDESLKKDQQ